MGKRRKSRELALQALFYMDMRKDQAENQLELFISTRQPSKQALPFFVELVEGVTRVRPQIDAVIEEFSSNWKISRMSGVDRNILRIAVFEMLCRDDIPIKVSINEAIDIGKKFGTEESGAFINGILDSIHSAAESRGIRIVQPDGAPPACPRQPPASSNGKPAPGPAPSNFSPVKGKRGVVKRRSDIHP